MLNQYDLHMLAEIRVREGMEDGLEYFFFLNTAKKVASTSTRLWLVPLGNGADEEASRSE